jgi:hypothetical protein
MKTKLFLFLKFLALVVLYFILFAVISATVLPRLQQSPADYEPLSALSALLLMAVLNTALLTYITVRSRWSGLKLIVTLAVVFFGVATFMPQIETAVFVRTLPPGFLSRLFLAGSLFSFLYAPLLVLLAGNRRQSEFTAPKVKVNSSGLVIKIAIAASIYVVLYFTFGYFVAWQSPAVRGFYGGGNLNGFFNELLKTWATTPWLFPFQFLRGLLWTILALPIIRMFQGNRFEKAVAVGLLFAVVTSQLLLPNPFMPYAVRMRHLVETASSNFLFGCLVVWLLNSKYVETDRSP